MSGWSFGIVSCAIVTSKSRNPQWYSKRDPGLFQTRPEENNTSWWVEAARVKECKEQEVGPKLLNHLLRFFFATIIWIVTQHYSVCTMSCTLYLNKRRTVAWHSIIAAKETLSIPLKAEINYPETTLTSKNKIKSLFSRNKIYFAFITTFFTTVVTEKTAVLMAWNEWCPSHQDQ